MQFRPNETQQQLEDSVQRFAQDHEDAAIWRSTVRERHAFRAEVWQQMADMGWLGIAIPEQYGGAGLGARECGIVLEGFGRALLNEPYWSTAVFGVQILLAAATPAQQQSLLPRVADGTLRLAVALAEPGTRYDWTDVQCSARRVAAGWQISGRKIAVLDGAVADRLLLLARLEDGTIALFCVDAGAPGLRRHDTITLDERRCSDFVFEGMLVAEDARLSAVADALVAMQHAIDHALVGLAAESVGAMAAVLRTTIDYLKTRKQFGKPLAEFQVLRHRVADMVMATEQTRSLALAAANALDGEPGLGARFAAAAKVQAGQAGKFVGESAVQLHGGIGVTDELHVGHFFKRLLCIDVLLGDAAFYLRRVADLDPGLQAG